MAKQGDMEVHHFWLSTGRGLMSIGFDRGRNGEVLGVRGDDYADGLGLVSGSASAVCSRKAENWYFARAAVRGVSITVMQSRRGVLSHRSLSRWLRGHAVPAMQKRAAYLGLLSDDGTVS